MQFSVDLGANAIMGGKVATGASGITAVRHGTRRENILQVDVRSPMMRQPSSEQENQSVEKFCWV
jgi:FAD/FMN-containing dehydrogenase